MAISRTKKEDVVSELSSLFTAAKATAAASYDGLSVADLQDLRAQARENSITIKVVKNRLVRVALSQADAYKSSDTSLLTGQLVYAFSAEDEVAPAQLLSKFAKTHDAMKLVVGYDATGFMQDTTTVTALANLPTKDQLRGQLVSVIAAPLTGMLGVMNGAQRGFAQVLSQRAEQL